MIRRISGSRSSNGWFIQKEDKEISPPDKSILFRWDFSENKVYSYNFGQRVVSQSRMNGLGATKESKITTQNMSGKGMLSYKSEKNKTARFVLENMTVKTEISTKADDSEPKMMEMKSPPMIIQGVKEDGNLSIPSSSQTLFLKLLFPLPETFKMAMNNDNLITISIVK